MYQRHLPEILFHAMSSIFIFCVPHSSSLNSHIKQYPNFVYPSSVVFCTVFSFVKALSALYSDPPLKKAVSRDLGFFKWIYIGRASFRDPPLIFLKFRNAACKCI